MVWSSAWRFRGWWFCLAFFKLEVSFSFFYYQKRIYDCRSIQGELFVIIVNGWKPLTVITTSSTLDIVAVLDPPLITIQIQTRSFAFDLKFKCSSNKKSERKDRSKFLCRIQLKVSFPTFCLIWIRSLVSSYLSKKLETEFRIRIRIGRRARSQLRSNSSKKSETKL